MMQDYIEQAEKDLLHTYNRYQIVFEKGEGVYLYDKNGKKYLDFFAGIAVSALGYHYKDFDDALKEQIDKLIHISNYYYNEPAIEAAGKLKAASGMDRVFFTNSGAEAIEGAIKAARKYAFLKDGRTDHEIIAMNHSFHGRTMGALSVTGNAHYREAFEPMIGHIRFAEMNDFASVEKLVTDKTCAILFETVQGEGGIYPATKEFMRQVKALCEERDILLILDEIQCGMGRTGKMFAWQNYVTDDAVHGKTGGEAEDASAEEIVSACGYDKRNAKNVFSASCYGVRSTPNYVKPDIMACAKAIGGGVPVGAFLMTERVAAHSLAAGDHGTTYGGNPLACQAVSKVLDLFKENDIIGHVQEVAPYLEKRLDEFVEKYDFILERRGLGLMQGLECSIPVAAIINGALEKGLVLINAGSNVLRFVPPLIITEEHIDEMAGILGEVLDGIDAQEVGY